MMERNGNHMIKPRHSTVVVKLIEDATKKIGAIVVPTNGECYNEAEVIAVGPGTVAAEGGISETFDLKIGQRVFMKSKEKIRDGTVVGGVRTVTSGIEYREAMTFITFT